MTILLKANLALMHPAIFGYVLTGSYGDENFVELWTCLALQMNQK